ncbi:MAG: hypothetical protein HY914_09415 [Desulfomonile tiedjei]|nr:hypothetical protein [Desulfomonile tiedjei]
MEPILDEVIFREIQRFRQPWVWILTGATAAVVIGVMTYGLIYQLGFGKPWGNNPLPDAALIVVASAGILLMLGVLWLTWAARLITEVRNSGLYVKYYPFHLSFHKIDLRNLKRFEARTYRPIWDYGGYGIKCGLKGKAYNVSGNRGVNLTFKKGRDLMIGSQRAEELARALELVICEQP